MSATRTRIAHRARLFAAVRDYFTSRGAIECDTPALQVSGGMEVHVAPFETRLLEGFDKSGQGRVMQLATSPEFALKRLLAAGAGDIFQLSHSFRNGERGAMHHPEFTMLEWYRVDADYTQTMAETTDLIATCAADFRTAELKHGAYLCNPAVVPEYLSVAEALARFADIDVAGFKTGLAGFVASADEAGVTLRDGETAEDLFHRVMMQMVEPHLGQGRISVLHDYPVDLAALARRKPDAGHLAERFEVYVCGVELANGYSELTDGAEQRARYRQAQKNRLEVYGTDLPEDTAFLGAIDSGLPACSGVALGVDRLLMLLTGAERIEEVLSLPVS